MLTAWIDEKKLDDRLLDFRKQFLGGIETFAGKSLRPFFWHGELPKHVFGLDTFMAFLGAIEILVLTDLEQFQFQNNKNIQYFYNVTRNSTILFGETAKHEIQKFDFYKIESMPFQSKIRNGFVSGEIDANASIPATAELPGTFSDKIPATSTIPATAELPGTFSDKIPATSTIPATAELPGTFSASIPEMRISPSVIFASSDILGTSTIREIQTQNSKIKDYLMILKEFCNIFKKEEK